MLEKVIGDEKEWERLVADVRAHGAFMARALIPGALQQFATVEVTIRGPAGELGRVTGQIVQVMANGEAAVMIAGEEKEKLLAFELAPPAEGEPAGAHGSGEELSKIEKIKLARQGNAEARRRILKDRDQSLHLFVLENPGLTGNEVAMLIRAGGAGAPFLKRVCEKSELVSQPAVAEALVQNPSTPLPLAVQLVGRIPLEVARRIAKAGTLRTQIVQAARKRVIPG